MQVTRARRIRGDDHRVDAAAAAVKKLLTSRISSPRSYELHIATINSTANYYARRYIISVCENDN